VNFSEGTCSIAATQLNSKHTYHRRVLTVFFGMAVRTFFLLSLMWLVVVVLLLSVGSASSYCQTAANLSSLFGPYLSYGFGTPLNINRSTGIIDVLGSSGLGTSTAQTFGVGAEGDFPTLFSNRIGLDANVGYEYSYGNFISDGSQPFHLDSKFSSFSIGAMATYHLFPNWAIEIGAKASNRVSNSLVEWVSNGSGVQTTIAQGDSISSSPFHFSFPLGLAYYAPIGDDRALKLGLSLSLDKKEGAGSFVWEWVSTGLSCSFLFGKSPDTIDTSRPPPPPISISQAPVVHFEKVQNGDVHIKTGVAKWEIDTIQWYCTRSHILSLLKHGYKEEPERNVPDLYLLTDSVKLLLQDIRAARVHVPDSDVPNWSMKVMEGSRVLRSYSNRSMLHLDEEADDIKIAPRVGKSPLPIVAEYVVTNFSGVSDTGRDTLPVVINSHDSLPGRFEQDFFFVGDGEGKPTNNDFLLFRILKDSLASTHSKGRKIIVRPFFSLEESKNLIQWLITEINPGIPFSRSSEAVKQAPFTDEERQLLQHGVELRFIH